MMQNPVKTLERNGRTYLLYAIIGEYQRAVANALAKANRKKGFSVIIEKMKSPLGSGYNLLVYGNQKKPGYRSDWTTLRDLGYAERFHGIPRITTFGLTEVM